MRRAMLLHQVTHDAGEQQQKLVTLVSIENQNLDLQVADSKAAHVCLYPSASQGS
jgi:hypothetical protein